MHETMKEADILLTKAQSLIDKGTSCSIGEFRKVSRRMDKVMKKFQVAKDMLRRYQIQLSARAKAKAHAKKKLNRQSKVRPSGS